MEVPSSIYSELLKASEFKKWKKTHNDSFLSHFFCCVNSKGDLTSSWEIGFIIPDKERIAIFIKEGKDFAIKMEDGVFKEPGSKLEELNLKTVKLSYLDAYEIIKREMPSLFPKETFNDGFVILQSLNQSIIWNFSFVTQSLKFLNVKINANSGAVENYQAVNVIEKQASS